MPGEHFWIEMVDKGKDVEKLPRKCVPFARVFGKKNNCEFFKGSWKITAIVK